MNLSKKNVVLSVSAKTLLEKVRVTEWPDVWKDEMLDLIRVLTLTVGGLLTCRSIRTHRRLHPDRGLKLP